jgi:IS5 family transposase
MSTPDFIRARLDGVVDPRHPLVVLTGRLPWAQIEQVKSDVVRLGRVVRDSGAKAE